MASVEALTSSRSRYHSDRLGQPVLDLDLLKDERDLLELGLRVHPEVDVLVDRCDTRVHRSAR